MTISLLIWGLAVTLPRVSAYFVQFDQPKDWASAEASCLQYGGHLASIHSDFENTVALNMCSADRCWIGFDDMGVEGHWQWSDGSSTSYTPQWSPGEPSNSGDGEGEDCGYMHGSGYDNFDLQGWWGDKPCLETHAYLCSIPDDDGEDSGGGDSGGTTPEPWFEWITGDWNACSSSCGWGVQNRPVTCKQDNGATVDDSNCRIVTRPEDIGACYVKDCPPSKYTFYSEGVSWETAEANCVMRGGHLAAAHTIQENSEIFNQCMSQRCWLGYNDRVMEGQWQWSDGSSNTATLPPVWAEGEPSNSGEGEDCAYVHGLLYSDGYRVATWGDRPCSEAMSYVCESQYKYFEEPMTWAAAESVCLSAGGHLARMGSDAEAQAVYGTCDAERCWMGLTDRAVEGSWKWSDGFLGTYTHWATGEPNNADAGEDCGYVHGTHYPDDVKRSQWGDHPCSDEHPFVCRLDESHTSSDVMACSYSSQGVTYDLTALSRQTYSVEDTRHAEEGAAYMYEFGVCGNTAAIPTHCSDTTGSEHEPKVHMTGPAPAYQVVDGSCWRLGDNVHDVGNMEWALLDKTNPAAGVTLTYKNGNVCLDDVYDERFCLAEYNGGNYCHRQLKLIFTCSDDVFNIPDQEEVLEAVGCEYQLTLPSAHGCPTQCPVVNNRVCNGHGVCGYDADAGTARCYCNDGHGGEGCDTTDTGGGGNTPPPAVTPVPPPQYFWVVTSEWSSCSAQCGHGTMSRTVACRDHSAATVSRSLCSDTVATEPDSSMACYLGDCNTGTNDDHPTPVEPPAPPAPVASGYQWVADSWSECAPMESKESCGVGYQTRAVACRNSNLEHSYGRCERWATKPEVQKTCYISCAGVAGGGGDADGGGGGGYSGWTIFVLVVGLAGVVGLAVKQSNDNFLSGRKGSLYDRLSGGGGESS